MFEENFIKKMNKKQKIEDSNFHNNIFSEFINIVYKAR